MAKLLIICTMIFSLFYALPAQAGNDAHLRIGIGQFPSTLHPFFDAMTAKSYVLGMSIRPATAYDINWRPTCFLCTELPTYDNGRAKKETLPDGRRGIAATYTIRPGASWGDGVPVTTKDILFAWEVGKHPQSGVGNGEFFSKDISTITAIDDKNFTIHFSKEQCEFASIGDFYALPEHLERKIFEQDPVTYKNRTLYNTDPTNPGLYWGPYKISKVDSGASITLDKNPTWYGATPAFNKITVRAIENSAALSANLLSGDIDYIAGEMGLTLDQAIAFEKRLKPGAYDIAYKPGLIYEHIDLNLDHAPFNDVRVRQALMYGMNRENLNRTLFDNKQPVADSTVNPLDSVYTNNVKQYTYDPATAAKLLDEAGWTIGKDKIRVNKSGEKLAMTLSTTAGNKSREVIQQALQSDWKNLGIDVRIENQPARILFGDTMRSRTFKGGVMYAWTSSPKNVPKTTLHSSMIPSEKNNYAGQNYPGYINPEMDKVLDDLEVVCEPKAHQTLWDSLQRIYADELPALPLYYRAEAYFTPKWLKGVVPTGHMHPTTLWIENWSVTE